MTKGALMSDPLTTTVKVAPGCLRTPGLFQLSTSCKPDQRLDAHREHDGLVFHFRGDHQLTEVDLAVLLAILGLGGAQNDVFRRSAQYTGDKVMKVRKMNSKSIEVKTSYSMLLRELGQSSNGDAWSRLTESLARLVSVSATLKPQGDASYQFYPYDLAELDFNGSKDRVFLRLCPLLAAGLLGGAGEYVQVRLDDFRALRDKSGVAQLLYFCLHRCLAGIHCALTEDHILERIYGKDFGTGSTLSMRRKRLRDGFERIGKLQGWSVSQTKGGYVVKRPRSRAEDKGVD